MIELPDLNYISRIADWIELQILYTGGRLSKNKILSVIEESVSDVDESKIDGAIQELKRRLYLYGQVKPYEIKGNVIIANFDWKVYPEHAMCLLFSTHGAGDADIGTKLFERLTKSCIDFYFSFESINFGFPSGVSFKKQVDDLALTIHESRGDDPTPFDKDRGADLVSWKHFNDGRNSHLYLLIQCAAGGKWRTKKPIPLTSWRRYISWNQSTTIPALAITQIVEADKWQNAVDDYGIIIDRARLFKAISNDNYATDNKLKKEIKTWCKARLS